jgi:23S rRNA (guanosine2251-2'-O)-methyltransferase
MAKHQLLFGRNILKEALAVGAEIFTIYFERDSEKRWASDLLKEFKRGTVRLIQGIPSTIRESGHQGIAFETNYSFYLPSWDASRQKFPFILLCNHLEDVQNLGGVARSAAAFGADLIVHEERRSVRLTPTAVKVSAGQAFRTKFLEVANLQPFCQYLKKHEYLIVGLDSAKDASSLYEFQPQFPVALVLGAEGSGISKPVRNECDFILEIPMKANVESLNATTAASVAMSWIHRWTQK